ncbi:hypothetical protein [Tsukamurella soli]
MPGIRQMLINTQNYQSDMDWLPSALASFGPAATQFMDLDLSALKKLVGVMTQADLPDQLKNTINPYFGRLVPYTNKLLPNLGAIVGPLAPSIESIEDVLPQLDVSELLTQALNTFGSNGANLTVTIPAK